MFHAAPAPWCLALNAEVARLAAATGPESLESNEKFGKPALKAVRDGAVVYQERSHLAVYFYLVVILACLWMAPSPAFLALSLALMMLHMDLYGAVLHVVLDHAPFIDLPIISPGCLEFQWHHAIPRDIVSKPFVEVCGDLNLVALLHLVWIIGVNGGLGNHYMNCMAAAKLMWGYAGQWSHRMAHTPECERPAWVKSAQGLGVFVKPSLHNAHHRTYDDGFPILNGITTPLITWMNVNIPNRYVWLALFAVMSFGDVIFMTYLAKALLA